ncbi:hypothetical protein PFLUV_G00022410 [Scomber scombrus]|uniref:Uncharacterized protein n=1 Tax=Scomber scombrus TaxID=13677 RepID=A0AAV1P8M6_SCOSC
MGNGGSRVNSTAVGIAVGFAILAILFTIGIVQFCCKYKCKKCCKKKETSLKDKVLTWLKEVSTALFHQQHCKMTANFVAVDFCDHHNGKHTSSDTLLHGTHLVFSLYVICLCLYIAAISDTDVLT